MTERFVLSSNMAAMPLSFWISRDWLQTKNCGGMATSDSVIRRKHINVNVKFPFLVTCANCIPCGCMGGERK